VYSIAGSDPDKYLFLQIICDIHILIFWWDNPTRLSNIAQAAICLKSIAGLLAFFILWVEAFAVGL